MKTLAQVAKICVNTKYSLLALVALVATNVWAVEYKECNPDAYASCFSNPQSASLPFILKHKTKTRFVAVLTHGLSDSPYYFKDIAFLLYNAGFNIVAPRLAGHGTKPEDLQNVTSKDWQGNLAEAVHMASTLGDELVLGGFSTGGALSIDYNYNHPEAKIKALLLFSPATEIHNFFGAHISCMGKVLMPWTGEHVDEKQDNPVKYENMATNGVCQLSHVINSNLSIKKAVWKYRNVDEIYKAKQRGVWSQALSVPVYMAMSEDDATIKFSADLEFAETLTNKNNSYLIFRTSKKVYKLPAGKVMALLVAKPVSHSQVPLASNQYLEDNYNLNFGTLSDTLNAFIKSLIEN